MFTFSIPLRWSSICLSLALRSNSLIISKMSWSIKLHSLPSIELDDAINVLSKRTSTSFYTTDLQSTITSIKNNSKNDNKNTIKYLSLKIYE